MNATTIGMHRLFHFALGLVLALALWPALGARAQSGISLLAAPLPGYTFGDTMEFEVSARSTAVITGATLFVRSGLRPAVPFQPASLVRGNQVTARVSINLAVSLLPAFSPVEFWWVIEDKAGQTLTTERQTFYYEDNRFAWQRATRGALTVHWYQGDEAFGQAALDIATTALTHANRDIRAPLPPHTDIYIYATVPDARAALQRLGRLWADGHADPALGVVIAVVAPDLSAEFNLGREIPHELTHVLVYRAAGDRYNQVPNWLNEGLAVINQAHPDPDFQAVLVAAARDRQLLSLASLCGPFGTSPAEATLAYAQSESVVRYIRAQHGSEGIFTLLSAYAQGEPCEAGVQRALGITLPALEQAWRAQSVPPDPRAQSIRSLAPWLLLSVWVLAVPIIFLVTLLRSPGAMPGML